MQTERLKKEIKKNFGKIALERNASDVENCNRNTLRT